MIVWRGNWRLSVVFMELNIIMFENCSLKGLHKSDVCCIQAMQLTNKEACEHSSIISMKQIMLKDFEQIRKKVCVCVCVLILSDVFAVL